ncbi:Peptidyl-prolyl cis-trans isomerase fkbp62 [Thalictrum thalictroides]|uniref:peptidylprolyl isomerase n=1 Tax=Thalictrum thalictroides TaxID=46969 RepID=A0A7J6W943_THATH|nr:Peptidyl-prolyl cis-trans isomerase fkbp62 [Thalictrum thalictroides]
MAVIKDHDLSDIEDEEDNLDEEPGEVIESAPPLMVGEEREINTSLGLKKKLLKQGHGFETPQFGDEVTVHYVSTQMDGSKLDSTRDKEKPYSFKLGDGQVMYGLDYGIVTMSKGEVALFTLPSGTVGANNVSPDSNIQFEVELLSWIAVVDICKDGGIIKKILSRGETNEQPGDLDEVTVKYQVMLDDGTVVAKTPEEGVEFYVKDGHFCPALPKVLKTMKRGEQVKLIIQPQYAFGEHGLTAENGFSTIPASSVLNMDLELVSFKPVIDVTGDTKVLKKILKEGEGSLVAEEGSTVASKYLVWILDHFFN